MTKPVVLFSSFSWGRKVICIERQIIYYHSNTFSKIFKTACSPVVKEAFNNSQPKVLISFVSVTRVICPILFKLRRTEIIWSHNNIKKIQHKISWFNCRSNFVRTSIINRQYLYSNTRFLFWDFALFDRKHLSDGYRYFYFITVFLVQSINL